MADVNSGIINIGEFATYQQIKLHYNVPKSSIKTPDTLVQDMYFQKKLQTENVDIYINRNDLDSTKLSHVYGFSVSPPTQFIQREPWYSSIPQEQLKIEKPLGLEFLWKTQLTNDPNLRKGQQVLVKGLGIVKENGKATKVYYIMRTDISNYANKNYWYENAPINLNDLCNGEPPTENYSTHRPSSADKIFKMNCEFGAKLETRPKPSSGKLW